MGPRDAGGGAMSAKVWTTRMKALPWGLKELWRTLLAKLRGEPNVRQGALEFAREHATPDDPASVLRTLDRFARERRFLMNVGDEKGPMLEEIVRAVGAGARVLELGSFVGYSAILMARHLGSEGRLVSIDVNELSSRVAREMAELAGVADRTEFLTGKSSERIAELAEPFDVVFLDHWKPLYRGDMERILARELLRPNAVVIADNVGPLFGDNEYVAWMQSRSDFASEYVESHIEYQDIEDGVLVSRRLGP
jgi:catechol O-methyltransferase